MKHLLNNKASATVFVMICFCCLSCNEHNKIKLFMCASWAVDTLIVDSVDITGCLSINVIDFYYDDITTLPVTRNICEGYESFNPKAEWSIKKKDDQYWIEFKANDRYFRNRTLKLTPTIAETKFDTEHFVLEADDFYMRCSKYWPYYRNIPKSRSINWD